MAGRASHLNVADAQRRCTGIIASFSTEYSLGIYPFVLQPHIATCVVWSRGAYQGDRERLCDLSGANDFYYPSVQHEE